MLKILAIGNSFTQDSVRYLYGIARAAGENLHVVNLYIGGCSLYRHYRNMLSGEDAYDFEINGMRTGLKISLQKALLLEEWDYIFTQQCSSQSWDYATYQPYLDELSAYIHRLCPPAKLCLQMTWAYDVEDKRYQTMGVHTPAEMIARVETAYRTAAQDVNAHLLLPTGLAMYKLYLQVGADTYRDRFHANFGFTRYMIGCIWFMALTGKDIEGNSFSDLDVPATPEELSLVRQIARQTLLENGFCIG